MKRKITIVTAVLVLFALLAVSFAACDDGNVRDTDILDRFLKDTSKYSNFKITVEFDYGDDVGVNTYVSIFDRKRGFYLAIPDGNNVYYDRNEDGYFYTYTYDFNDGCYIAAEIDDEEMNTAQKGIFSILFEQLYFFRGFEYEYSALRRGFVIKSIKDSRLKGQDNDVLIVMKDVDVAAITAVRKRESVEERIYVEINTAKLIFPENIADQE
ncbi:MAG: hypothetical protein HFK07_04960 [Clostridia bacterium]|nr:hypothetical protein [Clostridia bacterium]